MDCDIVFLNMSEAILAAKLDKTDLGDRQIRVELVMNPSRFLLLSSREKSSHLEAPKAKVRTLLVEGIHPSSEEALRARFAEDGGGGGVRNVKMVALTKRSCSCNSTSPGYYFALVEFDSHARLSSAIKAIRALKEEEESGCECSRMRYSPSSLLI